MTLTEKIIARAAGRAFVMPDDEVWAAVDLAAMHDSSGPRRIAPTLETLGGRLWDPQKIVLAIDHFAPAANQRHAEIVKLTRDWARQAGLP
ncbi:MAG: 3-isopropylmalate dehydratase, partial [Armatimonadetes bacterium]|nr:3-isopropylmalate dehydratase [Armatimonadota bacterium]